MSETFGAFVEKDKLYEEYIELNCAPYAFPIEERWRNNGLTADFLAGYWETILSANPLLSKTKQESIKDAICFIANELLENAMKFKSKLGSDKFAATKLGLYLYKDVIRFYLVNRVNPDDIKDFQDYIQNVLHTDPNELYLQQIELNSELKNEGSSRLGLLTMLMDYQVKISWKFEADKQDSSGINAITLVQFAL